ncbi:MAG: haloacid dehalogenase [Campylobacterales bacterium]|nr:haloacid dehalogenase [Campylobacterales bacterium]
MKNITIPYFATLNLEHIVLDYNGTIAKDGLLLDSIKPLLALLAAHYRLHVITADTFGSVHAQLEGIELNVVVLQSTDHSAEKADFIRTLGAESCAAIGNGNNDAQMLHTAALGIAVLGSEGCATATLLQSDLTCKHISEALELFLHEKRLIATLRR